MHLESLWEDRGQVSSVQWSQSCQLTTDYQDIDSLPWALLCSTLYRPILNWLATLSRDGEAGGCGDGCVVMLWSDLTVSGNLCTCQVTRSVPRIIITGHSKSEISPWFSLTVGLSLTGSGSGTVQPPSLTATGHSLSLSRGWGDRGQSDPAAPWCNTTQGDTTVNVKIYQLLALLQHPTHHCNTEYNLYIYRIDNTL